MLATLVATLQPMLMLALCILIGYTLTKTKILPSNATVTMAKLETWVFAPALSLVTALRFCTVDTLKTNLTNFVFGAIAVTLALLIATLLAPLFVRQRSDERGIYKYALAIANAGFMGDPVVLAIFGDVGLSFYKLYCLPLNIVIYTWGMSMLVPAGAKKKSFLRALCNPPTVALLSGVALGLSGLGGVGGILDTYLPFVMRLLDNLKACMGPVAMLLAGATIAKYDLRKMMSNKKVYVASALRLAVIPATIITALFAVKTLAASLFALDIPGTFLFWTFFSTATPLGLNTIVFPEAYGGNPETGASMAMISHVLCIVTIPVLYTVMTSVFGLPVF